MNERIEKLLGEMARWTAILDHWVTKEAHRDNVMGRIGLLMMEIDMERGES